MSLKPTNANADYYLKVALLRGEGGQKAYLRMVMNGTCNRLSFSHTCDSVRELPIHQISSLLADIIPGKERHS